MYDNFLATGVMPEVPAMPSLNLAASAPVKTKRKRSLGEVIGIIADGMAVAGGNTPMYETTMARREAKARADEEYARQQALIQQQQAAAQRFGQNPNDPTVIGEMVAAGYDPRDVAAAYNAANPREGSKPLPIAIAEFLVENPDHPSKPMLEAVLAKSGYVAPQKPIFRGLPGGGTAVIDPETMAVTPIIAGRPPASSGGSGGGSSGGGTRAASGGGNTQKASGLSASDYGKARARQEQLPTIRSSLQRVRAAEDALRRSPLTGPVGGFVPSALNEAANIYERELAILRQQMRGLTRVAGEGSMSDMETQLANAQLPSRTDTPAGRKAALDALENLLAQTDSSYTALLGRSRAERPPLSSFER